MTQNLQNIFNMCITPGLISWRVGISIRLALTIVTALDTESALMGSFTNRPFR